MSKQQYEKCLSFFKTHPADQKRLLILAAFGPMVTFVSYPVLLFMLWFQKDALLIKSCLIPAACFIVTTLLRKLCKQPRPFEVYQLTPLTPHDPGESFPSRHSASAMIIALSVLQYHALWGSFLFIDALLIGLTRILMAVHFPKDVLGGYLLAFIFSLLYLL